MARLVNYWVGQIPGDPLSIQIRDDKGSTVDLGSYTTFIIHMKDSDNNQVDLEGADVNAEGYRTGRIIFRFPPDRSIFTKHGEYVMQLEMSNEHRMDFTDVLTFKVRELGRK